ncbi:MAG: hypothetical protein L6427_12845 [Actinomycetia bacterium]|nr:hypothetical protein [Actinomycetes bacterium]
MTKRKYGQGQAFLEKASHINMGFASRRSRVSTVAIAIAICLVTILIFSLGCEKTRSLDDDIMLVSGPGVSTLSTDTGEVNELIAGSDTVQYSSAVVSPDRMSLIVVESSSKKELGHELYRVMIQERLISDMSVLNEYDMGTEGNVWQLGYVPNSNQIWALQSAELGVLNPNIGGSQSFRLIDSGGKTSTVAFSGDKLTSNQSQKYAYYMSFSPSGDLIAYSENEENEAGKANVLNVGRFNGSRLAGIETVMEPGKTKGIDGTVITGRVGGHAWLSEDRLVVVVSRDSASGPGIDEANTRVWFVDYGANGEKVLTSGFPAATAPTVSPGGREIAVLNTGLQTESGLGRVVVYYTDAKKLDEIPIGWDINMMTYFSWSSW